MKSRNSSFLRPVCALLSLVLCASLFFCTGQIPASAAGTSVYPEGTWTQDQLSYFDYLRTNDFINHIQNEQIRAVWKERTIDNFYTFRDLDSDGVTELILWHGYTGADGEVQIFTIEKGAIRYTGSAPCDGTGTALFCADHDNDFLLASYDGSSTYANSYRLIRKKLTLLSEDTVIPHRWYAVDWVGSLPLPEDDNAANTPAQVPAVNPYTEFLESGAYAFYIENEDLFIEWMYGVCTTKHWYDDIDNNGTYELLLWVRSPNDYGYLFVFTSHQEGWPELIGTVPCGELSLGISGSDTLSGFLMVRSHGYLESLTLCDLRDGKLVIKNNYTPTGTDWYALTEGVYPATSDLTYTDAYEQFVRQGKFIDHMTNATLQSACRQQFAANKNYMSNWYRCHDMDADGTDELMIWWGDGEVQGELMIFTYSDSKIVYVGSHACDGAGIHTLVRGGEAGVIVSGQAAYLTRLTLLTIQNGTLKITANYKADLSVWYDLIAHHDTYSIS